MRKYIVLIVMALILIIFASIPYVASPAGRTGNVGTLVWDGEAWIRAVPGIPADTAFVNTVVTDYEHHETHIGNHYIAGDNLTLANGGTQLYLFNSTHATNLAHLIIDFRTTGEAHWTLYEFPTVSVEGTVIPSFNRNRNFADASTLSIFNSPTITGLGNIIHPEEHFGSGQTTGGANRAMEEMILKPNTYYLANLVSEAANNDANLEANYYLSDDSF